MPVNVYYCEHYSFGLTIAVFLFLCLILISSQFSSHLSLSILNSLNIRRYRDKRDTGIQGYRDTGIQGSGVQGYRDTGIQGYRDTGI